MVLKCPEHLWYLDALPSTIPSASAVTDGTPGAAYTLVPHQRLALDEQSIRLVLFDNEAEASLGDVDYYGFEVHRVAVDTDELVWSWHLQQGLDQGLEVGDANWAGTMVVEEGRGRRDQARSKRSRSITLAHAATNSRTNLASLPSLA